MKLTIVVLTAMLLGGSAAVAQSRRSETPASELLNARIAYDNCLAAAARRADDGKSDAATIAVAIKSACVPQTGRVIRSLAAAMTGPSTSFGQAYVVAKNIVEEQYSENAIKAVLFVRTGRIQ
jgi:hypothetical protein